MADKSLGFNIFMDADTKKAERAVGAFAESMHRRIERAIRALPDIELDADASEADRRINEIRRELVALSNQRIGIDIDAGAAQARIERLRAELVRLGASSSDVRVQADTARASAALGAVAAQARRLDGDQVNITVSARDAFHTVSMLGLIVAGLAAVSAAAGPALAALAAIGPMAGAAAQGATALVAGFSGVGDAVKALRTEELKAAAGTAQSASSRVNSAQAIVAAQRAVEQAVIQADRAAITSGYQVADARAAVADAIEQGAERVQTAQDALTAAYEQGAERVEAAERNLTQAQDDARLAQEDLNRARAEAAEELEDLNRALRGAALSEREAAIRLAEAQERLDRARAGVVTGRELEKLQIDAEQAALALDNAKDRHEDLAAEADRANRAGVAGADQVVAAQRRADAATQRVRDAEESLADARVEAATSVRQAERALAAERSQAARDEERAREQLRRAVQQAAWQQQDASRAVADAQRNLANAYADTGTAGSAAANKVAEAMHGLTPETQQFARFLVGDVIPALEQIRNRVQAALLPKLETSMQNMLTLAPELTEGLEGTADVLGDLAIKGSEMVTSGPWRADMTTIMARNNRVMEDWGNAGLDVIDMIRHLTITSGPMVERFSQFAERGAQSTLVWIENKRATGELEEFFDRAGDTLAEFGDILGDIIVGGVQLAQTMGPLGMILLRQLADLVAWVGQIAQAHPVLTQLIGTLVIGAAAFNRIGAIIGGLMVTMPAMLGNWRSLIGVVGGLSPAAVASGTAMTRLQAGLQAAAVGAGIYTERITGSAVAGEKAMTATGKLGDAVTRVGSALPLIGAVVIGATLAYDGLTTSSSEAAAALMEGGRAAAEMRAELAANENSAPSWAIGYGILRTSLSDATEEVERLRMAQDPLTRATDDAARAQRDYLYALEAGDMAGAEDAYRRFTAATEEQARQQRILDQDLKNTTRSIEEQAGIILSAVEADIRYRDAVERASQAVRDNGATHDLNTEAGRRNQQALIDMTRAAQANMDAMRANGAGANEMTTFHLRARDELIRQAIQMGINRDEAQRLADKYLGVRAIGPITNDFLANVFPAIAEVNRMRDEINRAVRGITNQDIILRLKADTGNILNAATGGAVFGAGTETSDSIPAMLSHNEHVWSAAEVRGAGGHQRVKAMRSAAREGRLPRFAEGGPVAWNTPSTAWLHEMPIYANANARVVKKMVDDYMTGAAAMAGDPGPGPSGGGGVERWRPVVSHALGIVGQSQVHQNRTLRRMNQESGGNPTIVNRWDINWQKGTPSVGLMQVIGPTYRAYRHPAHDVGPYSYGTSVNPLSNILASMRYALARYGSLPAAYDKAGGYDMGGLWPPNTAGWNLSGRRERVLSPRQTEAFERWLDALSTRFGGGLPPMARAALAEAQQIIQKHFHLTVYDAANGRVDLETQFKRLELRAGVK